MQEGTKAIKRFRPFLLDIISFLRDFVGRGNRLVEATDDFVE